MYRTVCYTLIFLFVQIIITFPLHNVHFVCPGIGAVENLNVVSINRSSIDVTFSYRLRPVSQVLFIITINHGNDPTISYQVKSTTSSIVYRIRNLSKTALNYPILSQSMYLCISLLIGINQLLSA